MRLVNAAECMFVYGGDAAATRLAGTNSWGERTETSTQSVCVAVQAGPVVNKTCVESNGTIKNSTCVQVGTGGSIGGIGVGGTVSICDTKSKTLGYMGGPSQLIVQQFGD